MTSQSYNEFLRAKMKVADATGFDVPDDEINPDLAPHYYCQEAEAKRSTPTFFDLLSAGNVTPEIQDETAHLIGGAADV